MSITHFRAAGFVALVIFYVSSAYSEMRSIVIQSAPKGRPLILCRFDDGLLVPPTVTRLRDSRGADISAHFCARGKRLFYSPRSEGDRDAYVVDGLDVMREAKVDLWAKAALTRDMVDVSTVSRTFSWGDFQFSHDQRKLVFWMERYAPLGRYLSWFPTTALYLYDFEQNRLTQLVPFGHICAKPVFSPDDRQIAFYRASLAAWLEPGNGDRNDRNGHALHIVSAAGGEVRALSPPPNTILLPLDLNSAPDWSPDGKEILFVAQYNDPATTRPRVLHGIYSVNVENARMERWTPAETGAADCPSWAPTGDRFAYLQAASLMVMNVKTRQATVLRKPENGIRKAVTQAKWAPDADLIAYIEFVRPVLERLRVTSSDGQKDLLLTSDATSDSEIFWVR